MPTGAGVVGAACGGAGASSNALFDRPRDGLCILRTGGHIGKGGGVGGGTARQFPQIGHGGAPGAGRISVEGRTGNQAVLIGPVHRVEMCIRDRA